jgi:hypothetical protein
MKRSLLVLVMGMLGVAGCLGQDGAALSSLYPSSKVVTPPMLGASGAVWRAEWQAAVAGAMELHPTDIQFKSPTGERLHSIVPDSYYNCVDFLFPNSVFPNVTRWRLPGPPTGVTKTVAGLDDVEDLVSSVLAGVVVTATATSSTSDAGQWIKTNGQWRLVLGGGGSSGATGASAEVVLAALASSGTAWRAEWQAAAGSSAEVVRAVLASSGTDWRAEWQAAAGSSAEVVRASSWQNPASATNWMWRSDGTQITLTNYTGPNNVVIPDMLDGLPVTGFGSIFSNKAAITSISGGANITTIGDSAFRSCFALASINLPNATTIGDNAFRLCDVLSSFVLPKVTTINYQAFRSCTNLHSANLPDVTTVGNVAFPNCPKLNSIYFGQNAPAEATDVFSYPNVTNYVTNPTATGWGTNWNGRPVVRLPVYADEYWRLGTNLTTLLTEKLATNGSGASLTDITAAQVSGVVSNTDLRYLAALTNAAEFDVAGTAAGLVASYSNAVSNAVSKASSAWQNPASASYWKWTSDGTQITLTNYTGPNNVVIPDMLDGLPVTRLNDSLFAYSAITNVSGGVNITTVQQAAFNNCSALTSINLPNATTIGNYAFYLCSPALTSISIPNATTIGNYALGSCSALTSINLPKATTLGEGALGNCQSLTSISIPNVTTIGSIAFSGESFLTSVYFGQNAPAEAAHVYNSTPNGTNYVTNPTATGWGATWGGRPVVRLPVYGSGANAETYYLTTTVVVSNSLDFAITGLAANNVKVRYMVMFLSATNEAAASRRGDFTIFTRPDRLCDSVIYSDSNQLYWAAASSSAQAAGATTGTVADASGVVLRQRYAVGNGTRRDFLTATNANATTIFWGCTNKYATTATADTKIAFANYSTPIYYDDDSAQNSMWCRFAWTTPYTGTVTTIVRYGR